MVSKVTTGVTDSTSEDLAVHSEDSGGLAVAIRAYIDEPQRLGLGEWELVSSRAHGRSTDQGLLCWKTPIGRPAAQQDSRARQSIENVHRCAIRFDAHLQGHEGYGMMSTTVPTGTVSAMKLTTSFGMRTHPDDTYCPISSGWLVP